MSFKHFNSGCVFGRVAEEPKKESSKDGKEYISFKMNVSGPKCGSVSAYCRLWTPERIVPFLQMYRESPRLPFFLKGFYGQFKDEKNNFLSSFTVFDFDQRDKVEPRAVFILRGIVDQAQNMTTGDQRLMFHVKREGQQEELFELICPGEELLDSVEAGQTLEVKGYVRSETTEDEFGGSSGPIRAYVHQLKVLV